MKISLILATMLLLGSSLSYAQQADFAIEANDSKSVKMVRIVKKEDLQKQIDNLTQQIKRMQDRLDMLKKGIN